MDRRRLIALALVAVSAAALLGVARTAGGGGPEAAAPIAAEAGSVRVPQTTTDEQAAVFDGPAALDAVRTVKLFCDLVDGGRLWDAAGLFAAPRVWTRGELRSVRSISFRSGRVFTAPDAASVAVAARVRATVRSGSPVPPGTSTLFFTLGRVGTTAGGWLITAVTTSPQPHRKGSQ
jgi:hypothetical protein